MQADGGRNSTSPAPQLSTVWRHMKRLEETKPCLYATVKRSRAFAPTGYLIVEANGGLHQQRSSLCSCLHIILKITTQKKICNAVAVAGLLNAVLVVPQFQFHSVWKDLSKFCDIYDEDHFVHILEKRVHIVKKIPDALMERFDYNIGKITILKGKAWAPAAYYTTAVYPLLNRQKVIRIAPFANGLALDVPPSIRVLRCLTDYKALRFSDPIRALASKLVARMKKRSSAVSGKYISVHIRFEEDMVAFSCREYDGAKEEKREMKRARERGWRGKFRRKGRVITPGLYRINGKCPLTPLEVGMMLRGMGFDNTMSIYLASGKIYRAEKNLAPLLRMFLLLLTNESLATRGELTSFKNYRISVLAIMKIRGTLQARNIIYVYCLCLQDYSSRLAALDNTVCLRSEVFVTTQGGNFPQFLGHRRYLNNGHAKTINPDKRTLVQVLHNTSISWQNFKDQMQTMLVDNDKKGVSLRKDGQSIYAYPSPECMCKPIH